MTLMASVDVVAKVERHGGLEAHGSGRWRQTR